MKRYDLQKKLHGIWNRRYLALLTLAAVLLTAAAATDRAAALYILTGVDDTAIVLDGKAKNPDLSSQMVFVTTGGKGYDVTLAPKQTVTVRRDGQTQSIESKKESISKLRGAFPVSPESPNPEVVHTFEPTGIQDAEDKGQQRVTAANASGINDGAAAIVLASGEAVEKYGLKPMAKLIGWGQGGVDPKIMGVGPVPASRAAMAKAGVTIDDIDLVEANEAFAAQSIAVARELGFDMSKVNVNGGAIALGHPVGASGARIIVTLLHEMQKRPEAKKGLATLCIGGGMGVATVFEKC